MIHSPLPIQTLQSTNKSEPGYKVQQGPEFMSEAWRELFRHAVREADRCGITLTVNLCSGWDAGGPWVTPEHAIKKLVNNAQTLVQGLGRVHVELPQPETFKGFYRDIAVLAAPVADDVATALAPCQPARGASIS